MLLVAMFGWWGICVGESSETRNGPYHDGKTLREWLDLGPFIPTDHTRPSDLVARSKVKDIGTNGIPFLLKAAAETPDRFEREKPLWAFTLLAESSLSTLLSLYNGEYYSPVVEALDRAADGNFNAFVEVLINGNEIERRKLCLFIITGDRKKDTRRNIIIGKMSYRFYNSFQEVIRLLSSNNRNHRIAAIYFAVASNDRYIISIPYLREIASGKDSELSEVANRALAVISRRGGTSSTILKADCPTTGFPTILKSLE